MADRSNAARKTGSLMEKRGGYPSSSKPASQLKPPPSSVTVVRPLTPPSDSPARH